MDTCRLGLLMTIDVNSVFLEKRLLGKHHRYGGSLLVHTPELLSH